MEVASPLPLVTSRYEIRGRLGKGGMGEVYEAYDHRRDITVALKTLRVPNLEAIALLKREFRAAADLRHPNLVRLYDLVALPDRCFFTMELVRGQDLLSYVRSIPVNSSPSSVSQSRLGLSQSNPPFTSSEAGPTATSPALEEPQKRAARRGQCDYERLRQVFPQILAGLDYLHAAGKVHRDLKPQNILVSEDGVPKILDFGILLERSEQERETVGTPHYMSPEQALGRPVTPAADMYSLGCILFYLLVGRLPFTGKSGRAILEAHVRQPAPRPSQLVPNIPPVYDELTSSLLRKKPSQRPSAQEVAEYLTRYAGAPLLTQGARPIRQESAFIGRSHELEILLSFAKRAAEGKPGLFLIEGESGIGKSHLVAEAISRLEAEGWRCYTGRCYEREDLPYKAFDVIADSVAATLRRKPLTEQKALLPEEGLRPLARIFPSLARVGVVAQRIEEEPERAPKDAREAAFLAWREILARLRSLRPLCLVINDLQWADEESLALLSSLFEGDTLFPVALIGTARTHELNGRRHIRQRLSALMERGFAHKLELTPFGREETARLLETHLGSPQPEDLITRVMQESGGNPYFAVEFVASLAQGGERAEGPRARLIARVEALGEAREVLEAAVVAGGPVNFSLLREVLQKPSSSLAEAIDSLLYERFLREVFDPSDEEVLDVFHDRIREEVYSALTPERRKFLHTRFALALQEQGAPAERAADHFLRAQDSEKAALLLYAAAKQAEEKLAFHRAADLYGKALECGGGVLNKGEVLEARGAALDLAGRYHDSARAYVAAASWLPNKRSRLWMLAATAELKGGELSLGMSHFEDVLKTVDGPRSRIWRSPLFAIPSLFFHLYRARRRYASLGGLASRQPRPAVRLRLDLYRRLGSYLTVMDRLRGGEFQARFLDLALAEGSDEDVVYALYLITAFFTMRDGEKPLAAARAALARADALSSSIQDPEVLAFGEVSRGLLFWKSAEWEEAQGAFRRAETILRQSGHGDTFERVLAETFLAATDGNLGRIKDCEALLSASAARAKARQDRFAQALLAAPLVESRITLGDLAGAQEALRLTDSWPKAPPTFPLLMAACARARLAIAQGKLEEAERDLAALEDARDQNGLRFVSGKRMEVALLRATALLGLAARGQNPESRRAAALRFLKGPLSLPPKTFHATALRLRAIADPRGARADLDRAVQILEDCRSPIDLSAALLQRGALRKTQGDPGFVSDLRRGEDILKETGAADPAAREGYAWRWQD